MSRSSKPKKKRQLFQSEGDKRDKPNVSPDSKLDCFAIKGILGQLGKLEWNLDGDNVLILIS